MTNPMKHFQLKSIAAAASLLLLVSLVWLWTQQQSWKGVMLEQGFEQSREFSPDTLLLAWDKNRHMAEALLPGRHVHFCGLAAQMASTEQDIPVRQRAELIVQGIDCTRQGLAREPADAHAWARLSWFENMVNGPSPEILEHIRMSIYTGPTMRSLVFWRMGIAGLSREYWDQDFENLMRRQIIHAWRSSRARLAREVVNADMQEFARETLAAAGKDVEQFADLVSRYN